MDVVILVTITYMGSDDKIIKCVNVHDTARVCLYELCVILGDKKICSLVDN